MTNKDYCKKAVQELRNAKEGTLAYELKLRGCKFSGGYMFPYTYMEQIGWGISATNTGMYLGYLAAQEDYGISILLPRLPTISIPDIAKKIAAICPSDATVSYGSNDNFSSFFIHLDSFHSLELMPYLDELDKYIASVFRANDFAILRLFQPK